MKENFPVLIELKQAILKARRNKRIAQDPEVLADFLRQTADEVWMEAADCFLADLMHCFGRHLPLTSPMRSWLIRKTSAMNRLSDKLGIYRWKGGSLMVSWKEEEEEKEE